MSRDSPLTMPSSALDPLLLSLLLFLVALLTATLFWKRRVAGRGEYQALP
jgi:hypothetical protein